GALPVDAPGLVPRYQKAFGIAGAGRYVGVMPAQPYMRPALDQNEGAAIRAARDELAKELRVMRLL
ncbi:MAG TPA: hypothetical protein VK966_05235, partial [Longimicrobiales bacterium]|nr:hypothetical protein [Longimicrobiales bacterium]